VPQWRAARLRRLAEDQHDVLLGSMGLLLERRRVPGGGWETYPDVLARVFGSEGNALELWKLHRVTLLAEVENVGARPAAWWWWEALGAPMEEPTIAEQRAYLGAHGLLRPGERRALAAERVSLARLMAGAGPGSV